MKNINKTTITAFVLGIIVAIFLSHAYVVYQVREVTFSNQAAIGEIVNFLNQSAGGAVPTEANPAQ